MAEIFDVITRLSYNVDNAELKTAADLLTKQVNTVGVYANRLQSLQNAFNRTSTNEIEKRQRIAGLIERQKKLIDETTASIGKQVQSNQALQNAITKEIGLINSLQLKVKALTEERNKAFDPKQIEAFNKQIAATNAQITKLTTTSRGGVLGRIGGGILQGVGIGTGIGLVTQGVSALQNFVTESIQLAAQAEGVERAFDRLNRPDLLNNLREATRGTVSDLELMKQAVQFENFGLPVEKLGIALSFARQRAQDTGQSIDFLVQSIVTGIGRQSPLILDNLGINAKRVADRFKETGNFAEAAFGIIQEEAAKSGKSLDTLSDKQAQLNTLIKNRQAELGKELSKASLVYNTIVAELISALSGNFDNYTVATNELFDAQRKLQEEEQRESLSLFKRYYSDYERQDALGRRIIENQARDQYNELLRIQQNFFNQGQFALGNALQDQIEQYVDFFSRVKALQSGANTPVSFENFTPESLRTLNREQLNELRQTGDETLGLITDPKGIERVKNRIRQIEQELDKYSLTVIKTKQTTLKNKITTRDLIAQTPEQWDEEISRITATIEKYKKSIQSIGSGTTIGGGQTGVTSGISGVNVAAPSGDIQDQIQIARNAEAERKRIEQQQEDDRKKRNEAIKQGYQDIQNAAINAFQTIYESRLYFLNLEIEAQRDRVNQARVLAEKGNSEQYDIEAKRLNDLQKERERIAKQQIQLNAAIQLSNQAVALSEAIGAVVKAAAEGDPYTIAARIAAAVAALVGGIATIKSTFATEAFKDGVIDYNGKGTGTSDSNVVRISRGESVITADATRKNKELLKSINDGHVYTMPHVANSYYSNSTDNRGLINEIRELKDVVADTKFKQDVFFNEHGVGLMTTKAARKERKRWS